MFSPERLDNTKCIPHTDCWLCVRLEIWYLGIQASTCKTNGMWKTWLSAENHGIQVVENPPGEKLAADWNDCSFPIFNVLHHHYCCQSLLSIKLHKIQTLGNKHQCLSAYVKSQFFSLQQFRLEMTCGEMCSAHSPALQAAPSPTALLLPPQGGAQRADLTPSATPPEVGRSFWQPRGKALGAKAAAIWPEA